MRLCAKLLYSIFWQLAAIRNVITEQQRANLLIIRAAKIISETEYFTRTNDLLTITEAAMKTERNVLPLGKDLD